MWIVEYNVLGTLFAYCLVDYKHIPSYDILDG